MKPDLVRRGWVGGALALAAAAPALAAAAPGRTDQGGGDGDVRRYGGDPTGAADSTAAFLAAAAAGPLSVSEGVYSLAGAIILRSHCTMAPGAQLRGAAAVTFDAGFSAPIARVFGANLTVSFNPAFAPEGRPEWWGARSNTPAFDCEPALSACVAACPVTRLQPADYWIARTWKLTTNWRTVIGVGADADGAHPASRIVTAIPGTDIIQLGPDVQPARIDGFLQGVRVRELTVARSVPPAPPPDGPDFRSGASGMRLQYVTLSYVDQVYSKENINGFYVKACVATYLNNTHAARTLAAVGGGGGEDRYFGYFFDGTAQLGLANGNASVYVDFFSSVSANVPVNAFVHTQGGFTDLYFNRGECSGHANGMQLNGAGAPDPKLCAEDCHIHHVIMDGLTGDGILIAGGNGDAAVTISQCYTANPSGVGVHVVNSHGAFSLTGCQFIGGSEAVGLMVEGSGGVSSVNNIFTDFAAAMVWRNASSCESAGDTIQNLNRPGSPDGLVQLISSVRCVWRGKIKGAAGVSHSGVVLKLDGEAPCDYNLVDCSGIDPRCLNGGAASKLTVGGVSVTKAGSIVAAPAGFSHNVAAGVMD